MLLAILVWKITSRVQKAVKALLDSPAALAPSYVPARPGSVRALCECVVVWYIPWAFGLLVGLFALQIGLALVILSLRALLERPYLLNILQSLLDTLR